MFGRPSQSSLIQEDELATVRANKSEDYRDAYCWSAHSGVQRQKPRNSKCDDVCSDSERLPTEARYCSRVAIRPAVCLVDRGEGHSPD